MSDGWISVKDRLPHDKEIVLAYRDNFVTDMWYDAGTFKSTADSRCYYSDVTHWMPLPSPPEPPPAPTLTVKEALREAVEFIAEVEDSIGKIGFYRQRDRELVWRGNPILPRLRAALESEE